jgi:alkylated DNA repair dioxygenase AlkB
MKKDIINDDIILYTELDSIFNFEIIKQYLNKINDWKIGNKSDGNEIKRLQKWYHIDNKFFSEQWKKRPERWVSCDYDNFLLNLQKEIQEWVNKEEDIPHVNINSLLINKYRNGNDYIKKHIDSDYSFGLYPTIINMSIGESRDIIFTEKETKNELNINLPDKSIIIMKNKSQIKYLHEIPKTDKNLNKRYSLTWREHIK